MLALAASLVQHVQQPTLKAVSFALELTADPPRLPQLPEKWLIGALTRIAPFRQRKDESPASHISDKFCNHRAPEGKNRCCPCQVWEKLLVLLGYQPAGKDVGSGHCTFAVQRKGAKIHLSSWHLLKAILHR